MSSSKQHRGWADLIRNFSFLISLPWMKLVVIVFCRNAKGCKEYSIRIGYMDADVISIGFAP
jgi:hypothetical protein